MSEYNNEPLLTVPADWEQMADIKGGLIEKPKIIPVTLRRLITRNGVGRTKSNSNVGDLYYINTDSLRAFEVTDRNGNLHTMPVVNCVDMQGKDIGWIFAELFWT